MRVSRPISVQLPRHGVLFVESFHARDFQMSPRVDLYHKLIYVLDGAVAYREIDRKIEIEARAGTVLIVPREVVHQVTDREPSTLLLLCFRPDLTDDDDDLQALWLTLEGVTERNLRLSRPSRQRLEAMWRQAMFEWEHARLGGATTARALASQTIVLLSRLPGESGGGSADARVRAVKQEVEETFYDEWDLDRAAGRAGLSRRRFTDLFRQANRGTFGEFLNGLRLNHAARLLRAGEHSVTGVVFACGFSDVSHFYRMFRRKFGQPPRAWVAELSESGK